ncbi:septum site-determining protein MinC [Psychrobacter aestuarii]|uniref:Probable septum site-determining protein MinC n=1 Tax=Psychrobacter aestuarii TaxID=556327 RepID=A0ABN0VTV1_9GAMM|nr:septum site-determining protein MinC [Psychrobacter aestuarii]
MTISDTDSHAATPAVNFYGKMLTFSRLQLHTDDLQTVEAQLAHTLSNKESNIPIIIDSSVEQDLSALVDLLWSWGLQPIGVVTGILEEQAREQRLAIFPADGKRIERIIPKKPPAPQPVETAAPTAKVNDAPNETLDVAEQNTTLIYDQMLRSGQSLNHVGGDLILTNSVNSGAEAITDNSLHVYGRAQGRLVAGATGDKDARIFCQVFNPTLVSVAGTYCLRDNLPEEVIDRAVQVRFIEGEGLIFSIIDED